MFEMDRYLWWVVKLRQNYVVWGLWLKCQYKKTQEYEVLDGHLENIYLFKVNNGNTKTDLIPC